MKAATSVTEDLFGTCPNVKVTIGNIEVDQHFFVQEGSTYPIILGQPYITILRMETKVLDNGSAYAKIRSQDGRRTVQFMTIRPNHERNKQERRDHSIPKESGTWKEDKCFEKSFKLQPLRIDQHEDK